MKRYLALVGVILFLSLVSVAGCGGQQPPVTTQPPVISHGGPVKDYVSLIDNLRATGAAVEPAGDISQPFFSVKGYVIKVNGEDVQVFEYADAGAADSEAATVSPDGSSIGTTMVSWVAAPHFYQKGQIIVIYVGDNPDMTNLLAAVLGLQFAGR